MKRFQYNKNLFNFKQYRLKYHNSIKIRGRENTIEYDKHSELPRKNTIEIYGNNNSLIIGKNTKFYNNKIKICGDNSSLLIQKDCCVKNSTLWIEESQSHITIGGKTTIMESYLGASENTSITIGSNCFLERCVDVRSGDSHSIIDLESKGRINNARDIYISDSVWLAPRARILKGANIGNNCIVTESSIVTKNIPDNSLVSGVPAKIERTRVMWKRKKILF